MKVATRRVLVLLTVPMLLLGPVSLASGGGRATDAPSPQVLDDNTRALREALRSGAPITVIVQLSDAPIATYAGGVRGLAATRPSRGRNLDRRSPNAIGYARYLEERRAAFKAHVRSTAPNARVEAEYDTVFNGVALTLAGRDLQVVLSAPGVRNVSVDREFRPAMNVSRGLIGGPQMDAALTAAGKGGAGAGIKVGILDSGIERNHPFFDPTGYAFPPDFPKADHLSNQIACVSTKIIVARSYPKPPNADSCVDTNGHGTHVAGTVAGNAGTTATVQGISITGLSGVAHRAWLGNYNVFPSNQASARSVEIIRAIEDAVADGMDVLNMSLGGPVHQPEQGDPLAMAVNAAADANVVVAVAAGNAGPGVYTVSSPGNASGALTAGASTNAHFIGIPVTFTAEGEPVTIPAALGQFGDFVPPVEAPLANWNNTAPTASIGAPTQACSPIASGTHSGQIVLIDRGVCTFSTKIRNAQNAGAAAVLIVNNVAGDPIAMGQDGTADQPTIHAAMVASTNRVVLRAAAGTSTEAVVDGTAAAYSGPTSPNLSPGGALPNADILAGFSGWGPVPFDNRLKPDVMAPGVNVLSSVIDPETTGLDDWAFFQGTSMATPHVAGAAALLRQLHPDWTPEQIKSALVTRAKREVFGAAFSLQRGGGRINLDTAKNPTLTFSPPIFSFGWLQPKSQPQTVRRTVTFSNVTTGPIEWTASTTLTCATAAGPVATFAIVGMSSGALPAGGSGSVTVRATPEPNGPQAFCTGDLTVMAGGQTHRIPWHLTHVENVNSPPP